MSSFIGTITLILFLVFFLFDKDLNLSHEVNANKDKIIPNTVKTDFFKTLIIYCSNLRVYF